MCIIIIIINNYVKLILMNYIKHKSDYSAKHVDCFDIMWNLHCDKFA